MLQDAHSRKVSVVVNASAGDTVIIARTVGSTAGVHYTYLHELVGDASVTATLSVVAINSLAAERILTTFSLDAGQGITITDEPGEDNRPRFEFFPDENVVLRLSAGTFQGGAHYSLRY